MLIELSFEINGTLRRLSRFVMVGALGTFIDIGLFTVLNVVLGVRTLVANTISYSAGIVNNFVCHRRWTWSNRKRRSLGAQFAQFAVISLSALSVNDLIVSYLTPTLGALFGDAGAGALSAKLCATGVGFFWNYIANNLWTFRDPSPRRPE